MIVQVHFSHKHADPTDFQHLPMKWEPLFVMISPWNCRTWYTNKKTFIWLGFFFHQPQWVKMYQRIHCRVGKSSQTSSYLFNILHWKLAEMGSLNKLLPWVMFTSLSLFLPSFHFPHSWSFSNSFRLYFPSILYFCCLHELFQSLTICSSYALGWRFAPEKSIFQTYWCSLQITNESSMAFRKTKKSNKSFTDFRFI